MTATADVKQVAALMVELGLPIAEAVNLVWTPEQIERNQKRLYWRRRVQIMASLADDYAMIDDYTGVSARRGAVALESTANVLADSAASLMEVTWRMQVLMAKRDRQEAEAEQSSPERPQTNGRVKLETPGHLDVPTLE